MNKPFQRVGSSSNAHVGHEFEVAAQRHFLRKGLKLQRHYPVNVGVGEPQKVHAFDLGSNEPPVLVECKSHQSNEGQFLYLPARSLPHRSLNAFHE